MACASRSQCIRCSSRVIMIGSMVVARRLPWKRFDLRPAAACRTLPCTDQLDEPPARRPGYCAPLPAVRRRDKTAPGVAGFPTPYADRIVTVHAQLKLAIKGDGASNDRDGLSAVMAV